MNASDLMLRLSHLPIGGQFRIGHNTLDNVHHFLGPMVPLGTYVKDHVAPDPADPSPQVRRGGLWGASRAEHETAENIAAAFNTFDNIRKTDSVGSPRFRLTQRIDREFNTTPQGHIESVLTRQTYEFTRTA